MRKVSILLFVIILVFGILPTKINIVGPLTSKISFIRSDIHPFRNAFANNLIELAEESPYLLPSQPVPSQDREIVSIAKDLTKGKVNVREKSEAIFSWVAQNITYDVETFFREKYYTDHPDALEVLDSRIAMCMGYSRLNAALHRAVGIEARVVYGERHAWNEIKMNGQWVSQDPTYAAGYVNKATKTFIKEFTPAYFSKTDSRKEGEYNW